jgi:hypothetical protein
MAVWKTEDSVLNECKHSLTYLLLFTFFMNAIWFITVLTSTTCYITIGKYLHYKGQSESNASYFLYFMLLTGWTFHNFTELPWKQSYFSVKYPPFLTVFIYL